MPLSRNTLHAFLTAVEQGQLSEDQKQILLVSLSHRLRNAHELANFIEVLMPLASASAQNLKPANQSLALSPADICGTGGSGLPRINTSTLASLLLAHTGLKIAKHGNRAAAGRFGSFNLLEKLGVTAKFDPERAGQTLHAANLAFVFAPDVHPIFRHFAPIRTKIGVPTVFNILGPLVNPYLPERQFIGTAFADLMETIFETGIKMGKSHLLVVRGWDGLDEISVSAPTRVLEYRDGKKQDYEISPKDFGIEPIPFQAVSASNPEECLQIAQAMMEGKPTTSHYKLVAVNAAFIYTKFVKDIPLPEAYLKMERLILSGAMANVWEKYLDVFNTVEP